MRCLPKPLCQCHRCVCVCVCVCVADAARGRAQSLYHYRWHRRFIGWGECELRQVLYPAHKFIGNNLATHWRVLSARVIHSRLLGVWKGHRLLTANVLEESCQTLIQLKRGLCHQCLPPQAQGVGVVHVCIARCECWTPEHIISASPPPPPPPSSSSSFDGRTVEPARRGEKPTHRQCDVSGSLFSYSCT